MLTGPALDIRKALQEFAFAQTDSILGSTPERHRGAIPLAELLA